MHALHWEFVYSSVLCVVTMDFLTIVPLKFVHQGAIGTNITIDTLCGIMNDESASDPLARYAKVNSLMLDTHGEKCLDSSYEGHDQRAEADIVEQCVLRKEVCLVS